MGIPSAVVDDLVYYVNVMEMPLRRALWIYEISIVEILADSEVFQYLVNNLDWDQAKLLITWSMIRTNYGLTPRWMRLFD
jgi:hypothetical protein